MRNTPQIVQVLLSVTYFNHIAVLELSLIYDKVYFDRNYY